MGLTNPIQTLKAATKDLTWYFAYLLLIATTGPFLFGFHIVRSLLQLTSAIYELQTAPATKAKSNSPIPKPPRQSSTRPNPS